MVICPWLSPAQSEQRSPMWLRAPMDMRSPLRSETLGAMLTRATDLLGLTYEIRLGMLTVNSKTSEDTGPEPTKAP